MYVCVCMYIGNCFCVCIGRCFAFGVVVVTASHKRNVCTFKETLAFLLFKTMLEEHENWNALVVNIAIFTHCNHAIAVH